ncbi:MULTISPECIES: 50S ribosomal protein L17 [Trueperella]|uniref:Large ribosomal subunit protein bL17 n=1 Tax=Trueperella bernardiae TaxID=59561 RepID=A0A0W1KK99_9ACTO|nr:MULTISPECIES: 50S ribosomal protein L17 [Trueperella]KTF04014.1 50S ribosomal protein L17 [Trueperella bernardiae]MCM3907063.1 50S ribosomal protein L17 [Trueperella bernardiae]MDK8601558.1 50S ribosomal protein L17 [Trueperella bernardiae]MDV6238937.1 50S ribosomal protein L17 [Trueperella bernardiae]OFS67212.1 50S ribosomal protein L17 [Trueperella sp. HMSC08H06]
MPKPAKGPRLGGSPSHERKIIANLCKSLIMNEQVVTTEARAKRVRPHIEKLITKAKKGDTYNRRLALKVLGDREVAYVLFEELAPKFAERNGGYTRTTKLPNRKGDNAPMALIELVLEPVSPKQAVVKEAEKAAQKAAEAEEAEVEEAAVEAEEAPAEAEDAPAEDTE